MNRNVLAARKAKQRDIAEKKSIQSDVYEIEKDYDMFCKLSMALPEKEWIALLKVNSIEGNEPAISHKLYGMKVVEAAVKRY